MPGSMDSSINGGTTALALELTSGGRIPKPTDNEGNSSSSLRYESHQHETLAFPFLKLPAELRLRIYGYLLCYLGEISIIRMFYSDGQEASEESLKVSKEALERAYPRDHFAQIRKTDGKFATYWVDSDLHTAILSVNKQTYQEASSVLYSENCFSLYCGVPFLQDLSVSSRRLIKRVTYFINLVDFAGASNRPSFEETCDYLSKNLQLDHLTVRLVNVSPRKTPSDTEYRYYLSNLNKQSWLRQLVPLVKKLKTVKFIGDGVDGFAEAARAAQTQVKAMIAQDMDDSALEPN